MTEPAPLAATDLTRPRRRRSRLPMLAALIVASLTAVVTWRTMSLDGLPDIGDPFDVEAFCRPIPDETNAFVLYKQASEQLTREPVAPDFVWDVATEAQKRWLGENGKALAIWLQGTERPDALTLSPKNLAFWTDLAISQNQRSMTRLAVLESTRLESLGDLEGALNVDLAILRASRHTGKRGVAIQRLIGIAMHAIASKRISSLAERPEISPATIRRALDAVIAIDATTPPNSDLLKGEYLGFMNSIGRPEFDDPANIVNPVPVAWKSTIGRYGFRLLRSFKKEPARSRRVFRLIVANHLAYCDLPMSQRPPKVLSSPSIPDKDAYKILLAELYVADPSAPQSARALPPEDLARWFASTIYAEMCLPALGSVEKALARERSVQANLEIALANKLYERDHGKPPETVEELVGPYLKVLPEGYTPTRGDPASRTKP